MAVTSSTESSRKWSLRDSSKQIKDSLTSISKSATNASIAVFNRVAQKSNPVSVLRNRLGSSVSKAFYNPSDPLHAYPNSVDLLVHSAFQKISRFEVNNADAIRRALKVFRITTLIVIVLGIIGLVLGLTIPLSLAAAGRREDILGPEGHPVHLDYINQAAQSILHAINSGQLQYEWWHFLPYLPNPMLLRRIVSSSSCQVTNLFTTTLCL